MHRHALPVTRQRPAKVAYNAMAWAFFVHHLFYLGHCRKERDRCAYPKET